MCGDAAARERYQRTGIGIVLGQMRSPSRCTYDTRGHRLTTVEDFDVYLLRLQAEVRKQLGEVAFNAKCVEGQAASVEEAIAEATR